MLEVLAAQTVEAQGLTLAERHGQTRHNHPTLWRVARRRSTPCRVCDAARRTLWRGNVSVNSNLLCKCGSKVFRFAAILGLFLRKCGTVVKF